MLPLLMMAAVAAQAPSAPPVADIYQPGRAIVADLNRIVTPSGVQETFEATLGGARQVVNVRGADRDNPILIYVHGGPGAVEMPFAWAFQRPWEDFFTVVQWDQRGAGRSFPLNDPKALAPTMTIDRYRDDTIELIDLLRKKYGKRKVFLLGHSWGSVVGLSVAAKRPDLLYAYIGMGQYIDPVAGERASYAWTMAQARKDNHTQAVKELEALQPYPGGIPAASRTTGSTASANGRSIMAGCSTVTTTVTSISTSRASRPITSRPIARHGATAATSRSRSSSRNWRMPISRAWASSTAR